MAATEKSFKTSFAGKGVFPPRYAFTLLLPLRNIFLSPQKLIQRLDLKEDQSVLEIGPGPGYFSVAVARSLKKGRLVLLDIQQEMLAYAKRRLEKRKIVNVDYKLCDGQKLDFEDESFDRIFMVSVIGEIDKKEEYLNDMYRILKKDGILSVSELAGDPDKLSVEELQLLVTAPGFTVHRFYGTTRNYTMNFTKA